MKLKNLKINDCFTFQNVLFMRCDYRTPLNGILNLENGIISYLSQDTEVTQVEISVLITKMNKTIFSDIKIGQLFLCGNLPSLYIKVFDRQSCQKEFAIDLYDESFVTIDDCEVLTALDSIILKSNVDKELLKEYYDTKIKIDKLDKEKSKSFLLDEQRRALGYYLQTLENTLRSTK